MLERYAADREAEKKIEKTVLNIILTLKRSERLSLLLTVSDKKVHNVMAVEDEMAIATDLVISIENGR